MNLQKLNPHYWGARALAPFAPSDREKLLRILLLVAGIGLGFAIAMIVISAVYSAWLLIFVFAVGGAFFAYTAYLAYYDALFPSD